MYGKPSLGLSTEFFMKYNRKRERNGKKYNQSAEGTEVVWVYFFVFRHYPECFDYTEKNCIELLHVK